MTNRPPSNNKPPTSHRRRVAHSENTTPQVWPSHAAPDGSARIPVSSPEEYTADIRLYTPAAAAALLSIKESWLRRKAGTRAIPCTFLGRHLRFSHADLRSITTQGNHPTPTRRGRPRKT